MNLLKRRLLKGAIISLLFAVGSANAALINRGGGMIYDSDLNITWLQDANYIQTSGFDTDGLVNWATANSWATNLSFGGYTDWRLPTVSPVDGTNAFNIGFSFNGTTDRGFNNTSSRSELAYMFYNNLANISFFSPSGLGSQSGPNDFKSSFVDGLSGETYSFENVGLSYWTGVANNPFNNAAFGFNFRNFNSIPTGEQQLHGLFSGLSVWAVRDGDVAHTLVNDPDPTGPSTSVPEPGTLGMIAFSLFGLIAARRQAMA